MQNSDSLSVESMGDVYVGQLLERMNDRYVISKNLAVELKDRMECSEDIIPEAKVYTFGLCTFFTREQIENRDFPIGLFFDKCWESLKNSWESGTCLAFRTPLMFHADWDYTSEQLQCTWKCRIESFIPPHETDALKSEGSSYFLVDLNG